MYILIYTIYRLNIILLYVSRILLYLLIRLYFLGARDRSSFNAHRARDRAQRMAGVGEL